MSEEQAQSSAQPQLQIKAGEKELLGQYANMALILYKGEKFTSL